MLDIERKRNGSSSFLKIINFYSRLRIKRQNEDNRYMLNFSFQPHISPPLVFERRSTLVSATDSSTASSVDDVSPKRIGTSRKGTRERKNKGKAHDYLNSMGDEYNKKYKKRSSRPRSGVRFGEVTIREYERVLGDCWDIPYGLGLGWDYVERPAFTLPVDDKEYRQSKIKLEKMIIKAKDILMASIRVKRKKLKSKGTIGTDSSSEVQQNRDTGVGTWRKKKDRRKKLKDSKNYEDNKLTTPKQREGLLINFGFSIHELNQSEVERQILRLEYLHWTRESNNTSPLFMARCLAEIEKMDAT